MLDLGATHSFMANKLVRELDLWLSNSHTIMKIIVNPWPKIGKSMLEMVNFRLRNDNQEGKLLYIKIINFQKFDLKFGRNKAINRYAEF